MKKIAFIAVFLFVASLSFGTASAQVVDTQTAAELNSQLEMMKTQLAELQKQQTAAEAPKIEQVVKTISAEDAIVLQQSLEALKQTLIVLWEQVQKEELSSEKKETVALVLTGISSSVDVIKLSIENATITLPVATIAAKPAINKQDISQTQQVAENQVVATEAAAESEENQKLTASAASMFSSNKFLASGLLVLLAAMAGGGLYWMKKFKIGAENAQTKTA